MKIEKIRLKNFRSFGKETELILNPNLNIIIGENNSGKSNIFIALKKLALFAENRGNYYPEDGPEQRPIFKKSDWYLERTNEELLIEIDIMIEDSIINQVIHLLIKNYESGKKQIIFDELKKNLGNKLSICFKNIHSINLKPIFIKWGPLYFYNDGFSDSYYDTPPSSYMIIKQGDFLDKVFEHDLKFGAIDFQILFNQYERPNKVSLNYDFYDNILKLLYKNFKLFEDIRYKSENTEIRVEESFDGRYLGAFLLRLKNHPERKMMKRFSEIQEKFKEYFPGLNLEVTKNDDYVDIKIYSDKGDLEHSIDQSGTGIIEFTIFLSNLIGLEGKIFVFEEPELHLHPSAQRALSKLIKECSMKNQIFVLTHAPPFFDHINLENNMRTEYNHFNSKIIKPNTSKFDSEEISKLSRELKGQNKEIFFSKAVLLVEGPTELGALPIFSEKLEKDFDINNIYICSTGGKHSFLIYQKILEEFKIPYFILCDEDALDEESIKNCPNKVVLTPNFEDFLKSKGFSPLFEEAERNVGNSKPRKGVYVADRIPKENIPEEIKKVIEEVISLSIGLD